MKSFHMLLVLALICSTKPTDAADAESAAKAEQTKEINLEIKGLFNKVTTDWYIPNSHLVYLNLVPNPNGYMTIDMVETNNTQLQMMLHVYFKDEIIHVNSVRPLRVCVNLTN